MRLAKALKLVFSRWSITAYRLAKMSGVPKGTLSRILNGKQPSLYWHDIEKLGDGFRQIDPVAAVTFYELLKYPDEFYDLAQRSLQPEILDREKPENIQAVLDVLLKLRITTPELLEQAKQGIPKFKDGTPSMNLLEWISVNMQWQRSGKEEEQEDEEEI